MRVCRRSCECPFEARAGRKDGGGLLGCAVLEYVLERGVDELEVVVRHGRPTLSAGVVLGQTLSGRAGRGRS